MKLILTSLLLTALSAGCGTFGGNPTTGGGKSNSMIAPASKSVTSGPALVGGVEGALNIFLADDPGLNVTKLMLKMKQIDVKQDESKWLKISLTNTSAVNLLDYQNGSSVIMGYLKDLPSGNYQGLRFILDSDYQPTLELDDGTSHKVSVPSGNESGIKVNGAFTYEAGKTKNMIMDFDVHRSIKSESSEQSNLTGNGSQNGQGNSKSDGSGKSSTEKISYKLNPVVRLQNADSAKILKVATSVGDVGCLFLKDAAMDETGACENAVSISKSASHEFTFPFLPVGVYRLRVFEKATGLYFDVEDDLTIEP